VKKRKKCNEFTLLQLRYSAINLLSLWLVELLLDLLDLLLDELLGLLEEVVDGILVVVVETEPDEAEEDGSPEHAADAHVASEVDEEEEAEDHADGEGNGADEDSVHTNSKEGLDDRGNKLEETVDVLTRELEVLVGEIALALLALEVGDDIHDVEAKGGKKSEEEDPADEADDGELVADEKDEEHVDNAEDKKGLHEIVPHEDLLGLAEEVRLLKGLADHLAGATTRASSSLGLLLLGSFLLSLGLLSGCGFLDGGCGLILFFCHFYSERCFFFKKKNNK